MNPGMLCQSPSLWVFCERREQMQRPAAEQREREDRDASVARGGADHDVSRRRRVAPRPAAGRERERQEQPGGQLDRRRASTISAAARPLAVLEQRVDAGHQHREHQQVVVTAADAVDDDQRVEPDERGGLDRVDAAQARAVPDEGDDRKARERGDRLVGERARGDRERREHVAERREHAARRRSAW